MSVLTLIGLLFALAGTLVVALGLAWLPLHLLVGSMASNVSLFIQRQRERRRIMRDTPDRRRT